MSRKQVEETGYEIPESGQPLDETRVGELFAGIGNHEAKLIILGSMKLGLSYGNTDAHEELFIKPQGEKITYRGNKNNQIYILQKSFSRVGCVAKFVPSDTLRYALTEYGEHEGKGTAGHLGMLSLEIPEIPLRRLNGMTKTNGPRDHRPATDRLRIFRTLLKTSDYMRPLALADEIEGSEKTLHNNIEWLSRSGVVIYEAAHNDDIGNKIRFDLPGNYDYEAVNTMGGAVDAAIAELVVGGNERCTFNQLVEEAVKHYRQSDHSHRAASHQSVRRYASSVIKERVEDGILKRHNFEGHNRGEIRLNPQAREAVQTIITIADHLLHGDETFIKAGKRKLELILPFPVDFPDPKLCTDNGAMVAALGCFKVKLGQPEADPYTLAIEPGLSM